MSTHVFQTSSCTACDTDCDFCSPQAKYTQRWYSFSHNYFTGNSGPALLLHPDTTPLATILPQWSTLPDDQQQWPSMQYLQQHWTQTPDEEEKYEMIQWLALHQSEGDSARLNPGRTLIQEVDGENDFPTHYSMSQPILERD